MRSFEKIGRPFFIDDSNALIVCSVSFVILQTLFRPYLANRKLIVMLESKVILQKYNYKEYRKLIADLRERGQATGGNSTEAFLHYTDLNTSRMDKWDKRYELSTEIRSTLDAMNIKEKWIVLTEGWCGDAAHVVPVIAKIAAYSSNIHLEILLRDENLELMDQHLTNGGRSIPKLIRYNEETGDELGSWGPRPADAQAIFTKGKAEGLEKHDINVQLQKWYARDRGASIEQELHEFLKAF